MQDGASTPIAATLADGFLQLSGPFKAIHNRSSELQGALLKNGKLAGGAKFALDAAGSSLHVRADLVLLEEAQLLDRVRWALAGFQHDSHPQESHDCIASQASSTASADLGALLRETAWTCAERGADEFSAELDAGSAPPVRIKANEDGLLFSVELVRANAISAVCNRALAEFLLSASSLVRFTRAYATDVDGQRSFGLQVCLPSPPAAQEIDHALAALSIAYRMCAREASLLLDETAARCYLAIRDVPNNHNRQQPKEN